MVEFFLFGRERFYQAWKRSCAQPCPSRKETTLNCLVVKSFDLLHIFKTNCKNPLICFSVKITEKSIYIYLFALSRNIDFPPIHFKGKRDSICSLHYELALLCSPVRREIKITIGAAMREVEKAVTEKIHQRGFATFVLPDDERQSWRERTSYLPQKTKLTNVELYEPHGSSSSPIRPSAPIISTSFTISATSFIVKVSKRNSRSRRRQREDPKAPSIVSKSSSLLDI